MPDEPLITTQAWLWNGHRRLAGQLRLFASYLRFDQEEFPGSHLALQIPLAEIEKMEEFLIFDLARHGLLIRSRSGKQDLFVMEDPGGFRRVVESLMVD